MLQLIWALQFKTNYKSICKARPPSFWWKCAFFLPREAHLCTNWSKVAKNSKIVCKTIAFYQKGGLWVASGWTCQRYTLDVKISYLLASNGSMVLTVAKMDEIFQFSTNLFSYLLHSGKTVWLIYGVKLSEMRNRGPVAQHKYFQMLSKFIEILPTNKNKMKPQKNYYLRIFCYLWLFKLK